MIELFADQTGTPTDPFSILGGVIVNERDIFGVVEHFIAFKLERGLRASSPVKTAGWQENEDYQCMQKLDNQARFLTDCCQFIGGQAELMIFVGVVDTRRYGSEEVDERLMDLVTSRLQMEVQERVGKRPDGPVAEWNAPGSPVQPAKKGIDGRLIMDYPGAAEESRLDRITRHLWKLVARSRTKLFLLDDSIYFSHARSNTMLQFADLVVGAVRSFLLGGPKERFEALLPRFRTRHGVIRGAGLAFDPDSTDIASRFETDYPHLARSSRVPYR